MTVSEARKNIIDSHHEIITGHYEIELAKGKNADFSRLYIIACNVVVLHSHRTGRADHNRLYEIADRIDLIVVQMRDTHNNSWSMGLLITSSVIGIGAGVIGILPITGTLIFSAAIVAHAPVISNSGSAIGQSIGSFSKISDEHESSKRYALQNGMDMGKKTDDDWRNRRSRNESSAEKAFRIAQEAMENNHRGFAAAAA